jgi:F-type H+-transporting ATPase subunit gamma
MAEVVDHLAESPEAAEHPLFRQADDARRVAVILITADRGLAGGYNSSVIRTVERMIRDHRAAGRDVQLVTLGRKGLNYFRFRRQPILWSLIGVSERPTYEDAHGVVEAVMAPFVAEELDQIELVFTRFVSLGTQRVETKQLIPLVRDIEQSADRTIYEFEPEPAEILDRLLPSWLQAEILAAMLESAASEQAARQRAMKAATDNADELIKTLRRIMNRARQDAITTEIMEIVGGAEALRSAGIEPGSGYYHETYEPDLRSA